MSKDLIGIDGLVNVCWGGQSPLPQPCYAHAKLCKSRLGPVAILQQTGCVDAPSASRLLAMP